MDHVQLTVELRPGTGTLARLTAVLNNHPVLSLAYTTGSANEARVVVRLPEAHAVRARHKLRRLVDVIDVTADPVAAPRRSSAPEGEAPRTTRAVICSRGSGVENEVALVAAGAPVVVARAGQQGQAWRAVR